MTKSGKQNNYLREDYRFARINWMFHTTHGNTLGTVASYSVKLFCLSTIGFVSFAVGLGLSCYLLASYNLPSLTKALQYRPPIISTFYADNGGVIGRFFTEERRIISLDSLPRHVISAFLSSEDRRFYKHPGVDVYGIIRAFFKNMEAGYYAQGASTITQQLVRMRLLSDEKTMMRKMREALLAIRLERRLSKKQILEIYLNLVYFGRGRYGIETAATGYFKKSARDLGIRESAMLAALVSMPSKYSQPEHAGLLRRKTDLILKRMLQDGLISMPEFKQAMKTQLIIEKDYAKPFIQAPYFTLAVKRYIIKKYGVEKLYLDGLKVYTTLDLNMQKVAVQSLLKGAREWEERHGRSSGLVYKWKRKKWVAYQSKHRGDLYDVGDLVLGYVSKIHPPKKGKTAIPTYDVELYNGSRYKIKIPSPIPYSVGDVLRFEIVRYTSLGAAITPYLVPAVEGALVAIENQTGYVKALVGGLDFDRSRYNRAYQAHRQPGSAFKPLVFATALETANYGPETTIFDEPIVVKVSKKEPFWAPQNIDGAFLGSISLRTALARSRNVVAAKLVLDMGVEPVIKLSKAMGIKTQLRKTPSLALGTSEVTLLDLTTAYSIFANNGLKVEKVLVKRVVDRYGNVLEDNTAGDAHTIMVKNRNETIEPPVVPAVFSKLVATHNSTRMRHAVAHVGIQKTLDKVKTRPELVRVLSPYTAISMCDMLREVCRSGTAASLTELERPEIGGKTGTADDTTDAWFIGFDRCYTTGVWMGHDLKTSLGRGEYGATAALPIWRNFMRQNMIGEEGPTDNGVTGVPASAHETRASVKKGSFLLLKKRKRKIKRICPVDWYLYRASPKFPELMTTDWVTLGYARTAYSGIARILTRQGKTIAEGFVSARGKVVAGFPRKLKIPLKEEILGKAPNNGQKQYPKKQSTTPPYVPSLMRRPR